MSNGVKAQCKEYELVDGMMSGMTPGERVNGIHCPECREAIVRSLVDSGNREG